MFVSKTVEKLFSCSLKNGKIKFLIPNKNIRKFQLKAFMN